jgi:hypothetical protein
MSTVRIRSTFQVSFRLPLAGLFAPLCVTRFVDTQITSRALQKIAVSNRIGPRRAIEPFP